MNCIIKCSCTASHIKTADLCNLVERRCYSIIWGSDFVTALNRKLVENRSIWSLVSSLIKQSLRTSLHSEYPVMNCNFEHKTANTSLALQESLISWEMLTEFRIQNWVYTKYRQVLHSKSDLTLNNWALHCKSSGKQPVDDTKFQCVAIELI